jgi:hypothetical protein
MNIVKIIPKDDYVLHIKAENGEEGLFDVKPYLESEAFAPLKDKNEFKRIYNGQYFIEWDCGADLSADTIEARWEAVANIKVQQDATADAEKERG